MIKKLIRIVSSVTEWFFFRILTSRQREFLKNIIPENQRRLIRKLLFFGKWQRRQIAEIKYRLYNLGFTERGLQELQQLCEQGDEPYLKRLAAWELALWHANQYSEQGAQKCLELLPICIADEKDPTRLRQATVMEAECLEILGKIDEAQQVIDRALQKENHPDLYLGAANLQSSITERLVWINKVLQHYELNTITVDESIIDQKPTYDCLKTVLSERKTKVENNYKVTVIMPVYNAEDVIETSLGSVIGQTWQNLEIIVVDDCSKDNTATVIENIAQKDSRVKFLKAEQNGGAYVARNIALSVATGDFVTIHDADDWSHSEKIERQVKHLMDNPHIIGNTSEQARATNDMKIYRRGKPGTYIFSNMSSFMFRRQKVLEAVGYWDSVRFAADSEYIRRIKKVFGERAIANIATGPLSFQRQTSSSLTGNSAFGYHGYKMGARKEYEESHDYYHAHATNLYVPFPLQKRTFSAPEPMWPEKEEKDDGFRYFDIVYAYDFRLDCSALIAEIKQIQAQLDGKCRIGFIQMSAYDVNPDQKTSSSVRALLDDTAVQMLVYGEKIHSAKVIIRTPVILQDWQKYIPEIRADKVVVVIDRAPESDDGKFHFKLKSCSKQLKSYFHKEAVWYPINPSIRDAFKASQVKHKEFVQLACIDWTLEEFIVDKQ